MSRYIVGAEDGSDNDFNDMFLQMQDRRGWDEASITPTFVCWHINHRTFAARCLSGQNSSNEAHDSAC